MMHSDWMGDDGLQAEADSELHISASYIPGSGAMTSFLSQGRFAPTMNFR